jgi:hypothetical protein
MTTQEFVKQEVEAASNQMFPIGNEHESKMIASQEYRNGMAYGLTKGLEIADEFGDWTLYNNWEKHSNGKWMNDDFLTIPTTSELLTIFLTEKYGNNG